MIVVAIIGILSAVAIPKFAGLINKSHESSTKGNLGTLRSAISIYYGEMEGWFPVPTVNNTGLEEILAMDSGKYLKEIPKCFTPGHHSSSYSVDITVSSGDESSGAGAWGYQEAMNPGPGEKKWGDIWVNCTHVSEKGDVWASY
jgi:type II secretory pathway pseudopilin PulG